MNTSVHDSQATELMLKDKDKGEEFCAESAYNAVPQEIIISSKEMKNKVCEKGSRNNPLTDQIKKRQSCEIKNTLLHGTHIRFDGNEYE